MKVYTSAQSKTGISAVLTVMSGLGILCIKDDDLCLVYNSLIIVYALQCLCYYDHGLWVCKYLAILVEFNMDSLLLFPPHLREFASWLV